MMQNRIANLRKLHLGSSDFFKSRDSSTTRGCAPRKNPRHETYTKPKHNGPNYRRSTLDRIFRRRATHLQHGIHQMEAREARSRPLVSALVHRRVSLLSAASVVQIAVRAIVGTALSSSVPTAANAETDHAFQTLVSPAASHIHKIFIEPIPPVFRRLQQNVQSVANDNGRGCCSNQSYMTNVLSWIRPGTKRRARQQRAVWPSQVLQSYECRPAGAVAQGAMAEAGGPRFAP